MDTWLLQGIVNGFSVIFDEKHISFRRAYITYLEDGVDRGNSGTSVRKEKKLGL